MTSPRDHVRFHAPATLSCEHCEDTYEVTLPIPVYLLARLLDAYAEEHAACTEVKR